MFEQYVGDGVDLFIAIVAVILGFAKAIAVSDILKTSKGGPKD